jgi:uncharacterized protein YjeT (DUF2065 family)
VIGGYTPDNPLDALIVGYYEIDKLIFVSKVRNGFVPRLRREVWSKLKGLETNQLNRHGGKAVFIGRLIPAVRTLVSIPAGIAGMPVPVFLLYSGAETVLWTTPRALLPLPSCNIPAERSANAATFMIK